MTNKYTNASTQLSFMDMLYASKTASLCPQFDKGDEIFIVTLDTIKRGRISNSWICGEETDSPYYGYSVDFERLHTAIWDYLIGDTVFTSLHEVEEKAKENAKTVKKKLVSNMNLIDSLCFEYVRELDNYTLRAAISKAGDSSLYVQDFYTYAFFNIYETTKLRDKAYNKMLKGIREECAKHSGVQVDASGRFRDLYRVTDTEYADIDYALRHGQ